VTQAWRKSAGAGITVAVLGTGVAARHPDLADNVITGPDYSGSERAPDRPYWGVEGTAARAIDMAAFITSAGQARQPAVPPASPRKPARRWVASPRQASASALAGSVLRDAVAGAGVLIVLLVAALLVVRARRERGRGPASPAAGRARARGRHEHRKAGRGLEAPVTTAPGHDATMPGRPQSTQPDLHAAGRWLSHGDWQGGGIGEIAHSWSAPSRPVIAPAPKAATGPRTSRRSRTPDSPAGPPWEPAPEPEPMIGPLPVASISSPRPELGRRIRVSGDMAAPPGATADSPLPVTFDLSTPPASFDVTTPAFGFAAPPGPEFPTRQSLGFAAAPVPADYAALRFAEPARGEEPVSSRSADPSYIWDLAATDVFPAATDVFSAATDVFPATTDVFPVATDPGPAPEAARTPDANPPVPEYGSGTGGN
jgi:hypothetical protein